MPHTEGKQWYVVSFAINQTNPNKAHVLLVSSTAHSKTTHLLICYVYCGAVMSMYRTRLLIYVEWTRQYKIQRIWYVDIASRRDHRSIAILRLVERLLISSVLLKMAGV